MRTFCSTDGTDVHDLDELRESEDTSNAPKEQGESKYRGTVPGQQPEEPVEHMSERHPAGQDAHEAIQYDVFEGECQHPGSLPTFIDIY